MKKEKIAIVGSGISGISSSLFLSEKYDIHLFEKNNYLGGHTRTKTIEDNNIFHDIDTGFIVFNNLHSKFTGLSATEGVLTNFD